MLQLAPAALGKMAARRFLVVRARRKRAVVEQRVAGDAERHVTAALRDSVAPRRDPDDQLMDRPVLRASAPR
jgi:hypothetical protein